MREDGWIIVRATEGDVIPHDGRPKIIHETVDSAIAEAERLARREDCEFWVFQIRGAVRPCSPPIEWEWVR